MRGYVTTGVLVGLALLAGAGCETTRGDLRPAKEPAVYVPPPVADSRYSEPPQFPKGSLNQDAITERAVQRLNAPAGANRTKTSTGLQSANN